MVVVVTGQVRIGMKGGEEAPHGPHVGRAGGVGAQEAGGGRHLLTSELLSSVQGRPFRLEPGRLLGHGVVRMAMVMMVIEVRMLSIVVVFVMVVLLGHGFQP